MHFTSPIRRYADLVVHRAIAGALSGDRRRQSHLDEVGEHLSVTERRADEVSRGVADWLKCEYAAQFVGETFDGTVVAVTDFGVFVELDRIFVQGLLHISNLGDDYFEFYPAAMSLVGERSGRRIKLGDTLWRDTRPTSTSNRARSTCCWPGNAEANAGVGGRS